MEWVAKYWDFVEDGRTLFPGVDPTPEQEVVFREVAAAFLRAAFPPPAGCVLEVIEAKHVSYFPVIAVGWNTDPEPCGARDYVARVRRVLHPFLWAVDWQQLAAIDFS
jgi:hypothetical protein